MGSRRRISDNDLANFVVCPWAWWLKHESSDQNWKTDSSSNRVSEEKSHWRSTQETLANLQLYSRVVYILLIMLAVAVFLWEPRAFIRTHNESIPAESEEATSSPETASAAPPSWSESVTVPAEIISLVIILGGAIMLWDMLDRKKKSLSIKSGVGSTSKVLAVHGGTDVPETEMHDEESGLCGKPDAIIEENGETIPINLLPSTKKIQDRHIIRLLTHIRLVELKHKKPATYGILLVGNEKRSVKIGYTEERRRWLESVIADVNAISIGEKQAAASPAKFKCRHCDVREKCDFAWSERDSIGSPT